MMNKRETTPSSPLDFNLKKELAAIDEHFVKRSPEQLLEELKECGLKVVDSDENELPEQLLLKILDASGPITREKLEESARKCNRNPKVKFNRVGYSEEIEEAIDNLLFTGKIKTNELFSIVKE